MTQCQCIFSSINIYNIIVVKIQAVTSMIRKCYSVPSAKLNSFEFRDMEI